MIHDIYSYIYIYMYVCMSFKTHGHFPWGFPHLQTSLPRRQRRPRRPLRCLVLSLRGGTSAGEVTQVVSAPTGEAKQKSWGFSGRKSRVRGLFFGTDENYESYQGQKIGIKNSVKWISSLMNHLSTDLQTNGLKSCPHANHGAGMWIPAFARTRSLSFAGKCISTIEHIW